jgi:hypothetical protein
MTTAKLDSPGSIHPAYTDMMLTWELTTDLLGGTRAMKDANTKWLPKEDKEKDVPYRARLNRSVLFSAYAEAVGTLASRPFKEPVVLWGVDKTPLPEPLDRIEHNCDGYGSNLTQFCAQMMKICIDRGFGHILIDAPREAASNKGEARQMGMKPYFVAVDPISVINWRSEKAPNGQMKLTMIAIREWVYKEDGEFSVEQVQQIRVIEPDRWRLYQPGKKNDWDLVDEGEWTLGEISLVTTYLDKEHGFMTAKPPLEGLAWLNLAHYQSLSDHRNNLRFARAGTVWATGLSTEEAEEGIVWGVNRLISSTNAGARFGILEHSGAAVTVGENELRHLEEMMQVLGKAPLMVKNWGNETAMASAIDAGKAVCDLQAWVRALEAGIEKAYEWAARWEGVQLPEEFAVDIHDDFAIAARSDTDVRVLSEARARGDLSRKTFLQQIKLRGVLTEDVDLDEELKAIASEPPALGMFGRYDTEQEGQENEE